MFTDAEAPFDIDQVPPEIGCVYCDELFSHIIVAPLISKIPVGPATKLEVVPVFAKLVSAPFKAKFELFNKLVTDELLPSALP